MVSTDIPMPGLVDIRWPIPGNSFSWGPDNIEPLAAKKRLVTHATAGLNIAEDGFSMAAQHVNNNGWPGIGVMFVITHDDYPGRAYPAGTRDDGSTYPAGATPAGAQIQYVGDLSSIRAGVYNNNPGMIHTEICGLFTTGHGVPSQTQLKLLRSLYEFLCHNFPPLTSINYLSQVTYHNAVAVAGGATECPGWQNPQFNEWFAYLQGGAEPGWWAVAAPIAPPEPPHVDPVPVVPNTLPPEPGKGGISIPVDPVVNFEPHVETLTVQRSGAVAVNLATGQTLENSRPLLGVGKHITIGGYFSMNGNVYARTKWATDNLKNIGVLASFFSAPTGNADGEVPVNLSDTKPPLPLDTIVIPDPGAVASGVTDEQLQAATVPQLSKLSFGQLIKELIAQIVAKLIRKKSQ